MGVVYHHPWNDPAIRDRRQMLTYILLASPTRGSKALVIVSFLLLLNFGTLYLNLSFLISTTYLRLKSRSIITCWGVKLFYVKKSFSCNLFINFLVAFYLYFYYFYSFLLL